jgi:HD-GYP domain-containing protein (c-di-GMP phosphodiesterase class II)
VIAPLVPSPALPGVMTSPDPDLPTLAAQLTVFAREIGVLYRAERTRSLELQGALDSVRETAVATMTALAEVVEAKDRSTKGHLDRTFLLGTRLAERVDAELAARPEVGYGFFLHDIGKVGIPETVLCKPGPLDPDEWEVMRAHPSIGAKIVEPIRFLADAVEIVRCHHERWDGRGYPSGLGGERIPLAARIFSVVDSFDAMTHDRPYRRAMSPGGAFEQIRNGSGTQFDPSVAATFLDMMS